MNVEVDQSGKFENTQTDTVLSVANYKFSYSILITNKEKRKFFTSIKHLRPSWTKHMANIQAFGIMLYLLLKPNVSKFNQIKIDTEYVGHEGVIKDRTLSLLNRHRRLIFTEQIIFRQIGKNSPSHATAIAVFRKILSPNSTIISQDILKVIPKE